MPHPLKKKLSAILGMVRKAFQGSTKRKEAKRKNQGSRYSVTTKHFKSDRGAEQES
jgi:hypothetical protein